MYRLRRKAAALGAAVFLLVGTSLLAFPGTASAETKKVACGGEVTAKPGDKIVATMTKQIPLLGSSLLTFDLGTVKKSTGVLTGTAADLVSGTLGSLTGVVCKVTVKVADDVVEKVPAVGGAAADTLKKGAEQLHDTTRDTTDTLNDLVSPGSDPDRHEPQPGQPSGESGDAEGDSDQNGSRNGSHGIASPASPAVGGGVPLQPAFLPLSFGSGFAPMRDYGGIPFAMPGLFAPAPGVRYGSDIPGYAPEFDVLGLGKNKPGGGSAPDERVAEAGQARALPTDSGAGGNPASLPVLMAVVALAASTAGLVRTWVLRRA